MLAIDKRGGKLAYKLVGMPRTSPLKSSLGCCGWSCVPVFAASKEPVELQPTQGNSLGKLREGLEYK